MVASEIHFTFSFPLHAPDQLLCFLLPLSVDEAAKSRTAGKRVLYGLETARRKVPRKDIYCKGIKV